MGGESGHSANAGSLQKPIPRITIIDTTQAAFHRSTSGPHCGVIVRAPTPETTGLEFPFDSFSESRPYCRVESIVF